MPVAKRRGRRPKLAVIYMIKCVANNFTYVGSSKDFAMRMNSHLFDLINLKHCNTGLLKDFKKYGIKGFSFSILEIVLNEKLLKKREQHYMDSINKSKLYNKRRAVS